MTRTKNISGVWATSPGGAAERCYKPIARYLFAEAPSGTPYMSGTEPTRVADDEGHYSLAVDYEGNCVGPNRPSERGDIDAAISYQEFGTGTLTRRQMADTRASILGLPSGFLGRLILFMYDRAPKWLVGWLYR